MSNMFFVVATVTGHRYRVRKDTECPFLRNIIALTPTVTADHVPNIDNTGPFVIEGTLVINGTNLIVKDAFEMIGANDNEQKFRTFGDACHYTDFGPNTDQIPGTNWSVVAMRNKYMSQMIRKPNPAIKACEGYNTNLARSEGRGSGFACGSIVAADETFLLIDFTD